MISAKQCAIDEFAALPIEKHITGSYAITTPGVPSKIYLETLHRYGIKTDDKLMAQVHPHDPHWLAEQADQDAIYQVIVPANYSKMLPYGILVFINSRDSGMLFRQYHPLLEKHRLIAIGADHSGNTHATIIRHVYAVAAACLLLELYNIDKDRIYITGVSGGGRVTSQVMLMNADLFTGGIPIIGSNPYRDLPIAGNRYVPGFWRRPDQRILNHARRNSRYAFMTGSKDYNRAVTKRIYEEYRKRRFRYVSYFEEPGYGHTVPSAGWFERAIMFLDKPLVDEIHRASYRRRPDFE
ncbi:MAG: hypothetical protein PF630_11250 [Gammaproteobacteria bacterium]|jgi:dienelactone hydrolase|nr:hypothetical protein [Gammaproteobacteria bacterium]